MKSLFYFAPNYSKHHNDVNASMYARFGNYTRPEVEKTGLGRHPHDILKSVDSNRSFATSIRVLLSASTANISPRMHKAISLDRFRAVILAPEQIVFLSLEVIWPCPFGLHTYRMYQRTESIMCLGLHVKKTWPFHHRVAWGYSGRWFVPSNHPHFCYHGRFAPAKDKDNKEKKENEK